MVCEIIILDFLALDYGARKTKIMEDLTALKEKLKDKGVRLFEYKEKTKDVIKKQIFELFSAVYCDLDPDFYLYIYSREEDIKETIGKNKFAYKIERFN